MILDNKYLNVAEDGTLTFLYSLWKLPTVEGAFEGILEGKASKGQELGICNDIHERRRDWLLYGPRPEAWEQFTKVTLTIGKKLHIQIRSPIMFLHEDEGPYPIDAFCSGVNLSLNQDGFLQCYMCLKDVSCQLTPKGYDGCGRLKQAPDGVFLLNLGDVYKISTFKTQECAQLQMQSTEGVSFINGKPNDVGVHKVIEDG